MFTHIVLFKLKDPSEENTAKIKAALESLPAVISFIRELEVGVDIVRSARSFDISLLTRFDSKSDMEAYQIHPEHQKVAAMIVSASENIVAVDY